MSVAPASPDVPPCVGAAAAPDAPPCVVDEADDSGGCACNVGAAVATDALPCVVYTFILAGW